MICGPSWQIPAKNNGSGPGRKLEVNPGIVNSTSGRDLLPGLVQDISQAFEMTDRLNRFQ
jgi:hypothetical protein